MVPLKAREAAKSIFETADRPLSQAILVGPVLARDPLLLGRPVLFEWTYGFSFAALRERADHTNLH
jgi:hypothetical protein